MKFKKNATENKTENEAANEIKKQTEDEVECEIADKIKKLKYLAEWMNEQQLKQINKLLSDLNKVQNYNFLNLPFSFSDLILNFLGGTCVCKIYIREVWLCRLVGIQRK